MENKEIYKIIPDYENYSVSNLGNIMNTKTGKAIKTTVNSRVNIVANLVKDGKQNTFTIKSLIEKAHDIKIEATEETTEPEIKKVKTKVHKFLKPRKPKTYNPLCVVKVEFNPKPILL